MFAYYLELALRRLRGSPGLTALMMLTIGFGVAGSMTTYAVFRSVSSDPIPWKSTRLFVPQVDSWGPTGRYRNGEPREALSYADAMALQRDHRAAHQSAIYAIAPPVLPARAAAGAIPVGGFAVFSEFFPMLDVPFRHGGGWSAEDDAQRADVVVISSQLNQQVFGGGDSVGRTVNVAGRDYRVAGVLADWNPQPIFYDVDDTGGFSREPPGLFMPLPSAIAANLANSGNTNCPRDGQPTESGFVGLQRSECIWLAYLVELDDAAAVRRYRQYLDAYAGAQQQAGRFHWAPNTRLRDVPAFLAHMHVVPDDTRVALLVALGLLAVCLVNTAGLLLAKFLRASGEIGVRRALGASRRAIHAQFLVEAGVVGVGGGALGLALTFVGVLGVGGVLPPRMAGLAHVDAPLLAWTLALAVLATLAAGLYPTYRAARVQPAWQLKCQ